MSELSIYIHWPFCKSKCPYCDFNSHEFTKIDYNRYLNAYLKELEFNKALIKNKIISSIFFGGGTPSLMKVELVDKILKKISSMSHITENTEITLEVNPNSVDRNKFLEFKSVGINRISIGIQSFREKNLKFLGRSHSSADAFKAIDLASNIFDNYSFDLMYCLPNQTIEDWQDEIFEAIKYVSYHISCYQLTIEKGTKFYKDYKSQSFIMPDENTSSQMYNLICDLLDNNQIKQYEISNFSKPGYECKHNVNYWLLNNYIGIGPGAHGRYKLGNERYSTINFYTPSKWMAYIEADKIPIQSKNKISTQDDYIDTLTMGLRLNKGLEISKIQNKQPLNSLVNSGLIEINSNLVSCTNNGRLVLNSLIEHLLQ